MKRVIHWFRRDLRITDNSALYYACKQSAEIVPVYILSTWKRSHGWTGPNRQEFLCGCLKSLAKNLHALGGRLILRAGDPVEQLCALVKETGAEAIYFNRVYDPYDVALEQRLEAQAAHRFIKIRSYKDLELVGPEELMSRDHRPFRIFTHYSRAWHLVDKPKPLPKISQCVTPRGVDSLDIPTLEHWELKSEAKIIEPGERAARDRLKRFLNGPIFEYARRRNFPAAGGSSRLSQDLRFGTLSPRTIYSACENAARECNVGERDGVNAFLNELAWREFYIQILWHFPTVLQRDFNDQFAILEWDENDEAFRRWSLGLTGFPIVDAGMRELNATGFMHNRLRMIVAMFLTKDLHIHWRRGEQYFLQKLVDGDVAANNGGWQWSAGTGAYAAPYFRIQNPWTQAARYDPSGEYIKLWVPELKKVPGERLTRPSKQRLAKEYPLSMVDHGKEREIALERFNQARRQMR
jgi:deoxyribodipyrimidine photo-lyase